MKTYIIVALLMFNTAITAQVYPSWFLMKPDVSCKLFVGIVKTGFYNDSSYAVAFQKACENAVKYAQLKIFFDQVFISAVDKKYWADFTKQIEYDTSLIPYYLQSFSVIDSFQTKDITIVLAGDENCFFADNYIKNISYNKPVWLNEIPKDNNYLYAIGLSPEYYYETSSWEAAENSALLELAKQKFLLINSEQFIEKGTFTDWIIDIQNETLLATLNNIEVIERWYDRKESTYHVLIRALKY